ncbi:MAG: MGH1-like glycoside hydrolase domain-containing protein, partial [Candidatus Helarchaeales archaeon]
FNGPFVVPFNSRSELEKRIPFNSPMLWRGPCIWININWIAARAAAKYGRKDISKQITERTVELLMKSDFREFYHPEKGIGGGAKSFTWPALVLDMINNYS